MHCLKLFITLYFEATWILCHENLTFCSRNMQKAFSVLNTPLGLMKLVRCVRYGSGSVACLTSLPLHRAPPSLEYRNTPLAFLWRSWSRNRWGRRARAQQLHFSRCCYNIAGGMRWNNSGSFNAICLVGLLRVEYNSSPSLQPSSSSLVRNR